MGQRNWNILSWNVRGINSEQKLLAIRNCVESCGCDVVCLQETKRSAFDLAFIKTFCPKKFDKYAFIPSRGASGGLITIWNSSVFSGTVISSEFFAQVINFKSTQSDEVWNLVNVYGPCQGADRHTYTEWLFDLPIADDENWILLGDFNYIRSPTDRNKPGGDANDMLKFNEFIREQGLVELPVKGRNYTWSNMQQDPLLENSIGSSRRTNGQLRSQIQWSLHWPNQFRITLRALSLFRPLSRQAKSSDLKHTGPNTRNSLMWLANVGPNQAIYQTAPQEFVKNSRG